jgi:hypothetical protein
VTAFLEALSEDNPECVCFCSKCWQLDLFGKYCEDVLRRALLSILFRFRELFVLFNKALNF